MGRKEANELLKLDVRIVSSIYINGDFGIYTAQLLNAKEVAEDKNFIDREEEITLSGNFDRRFYYGEEYIMYGVKHIHPRFGLQYKVQMVQTKFDTPDRIKAFLKGFCADNIVNQLLDKYGAEVINRILDDTLDYSDIKGMGEVRFKSLQDKVKENEYMKDIIINLSDYGITPNQMKKIVRKFGANAISKIQENPYILCEVHGIGFLKADEIAERMGYDMQSPNRIDEAVKYVIGEMQKSGNAWVHRGDLTDKVCDLTVIGADKIDARIYEGIHGVFVKDSYKVTLQVTFEAEQYIADRLREMLDMSEELDIDVDAFLKEELGDELTLTEEQMSFFHNLKKYNVNFLVGYAGCGKSFLQKIALSMAQKLGIHTTLLLAPTGKAAKVMETYTGRKAYTIHRALGIGMDFEQVREVWDELILVDESSMADVYVLSKLCQALKNPKARIIFIGDDFQIPSVGVGAFLYDCIQSGTFPVTKLTRVFRQAEGGVLDVATKIRMKERFISDTFTGKKQFGKDMLLHCCNSPSIEKGYKYYYEKALEKFSVDEIIILTPTKKGALGTERINAEIQQIVNPASPMKKEVKFGQSIVYREGDRVINIKNNYGALNLVDEPVVVVNGDMGVIVEVNNEKMHIVVDYGFDHIKVPFNALDTILHAYAMTIHKSQGSGFPCVIVIADKAHKWQLNANLLYTAITRTQKYLCMLTQADVINSSMSKNVNLQRNTFLQELLTV